MAQVRFLLHEPYKKGVLKEVKERRAKKKDIKSLLNPKETRLYLYFIINRQDKLKIKTDEKVLAAHWDFEEQQLKAQVPGSTEFNRRITNLKLSVQDIYRKILNETPGIKFPEIAENIKAFIQTDHVPIFDDKNKNFWTVYEEYVDSKSNKVTYRTVQKYRTLEKSLKEYCKQYYPGFGFRHIDLTFIEKYILHLQTQEPRGRQKSREKELQTGLLNDSIGKYIENLKNFLKWSYERNYHENKIFEHREFSVKRLSVNEIVTLTLAELKELFEYDLSKVPRLEKVRDVFCFGCFTGQRWGDIENYRADQIQGDMWVFNAQKTKKETQIPLIGYSAPALEILKKYDFELPKITSQKFNEYLKEVGKKIKLNRSVKIRRYIGKKEIEIEQPLHKFMSSHMARRTCVSILLNVERMPLVLVQQITGHSDLKTLQKYINKDIDALRAYLEQAKGVENETYLKIVGKQTG